MRIGLVIGAAQFGGAERQVQRLALALEASGAEVWVLALERPGRRGAALRLDFASTPLLHLWHSRWLPKLSEGNLRRAVHRHGIEVLHFYHLEAMALAPALRSGAALAVGSIRGLSFTHSEAARRSLRRSLPALAALTTNCRVIATEFRRLFPECTLPLQVLPNLVDAAPLAAAPTAAGALRVLFVGTLKPVKNPLLLVEAAVLLRNQGLDPQPHYRIVGDGMLRAAMHARVTQAGLQERFEFAGALPPEQVPFAAHDVVVSTSHREGSSNALLESLAYGVAVIGTDVGGTSELVRDSGGGLLVPDGDAAALANAVRELATQPARRQAMGQSGHAYIARVHAPDRLAAAHLELYRAWRSGGR